ncbi:hypothetical protein [uncultured Chryseobacterium sp.]|uniref:hypothetical protein n=1 Tax=uncultured Chryseobacterium sp. TaxID=259322 RepID=UPI00374A8349
MNSFYKSIGLYDSLNLSIEMDGSEFTESLRKITYKTNTTFLSLISDNGIPTRFEYRGIVNPDHFTIKKRAYFFDFNVIHSVIKGNLSKENDRTVITVEFVPFLPYFLMLICMMPSMIFIALQFFKEDENFILTALPFILLLIQYFGLKRAIKKDKYDFERELYLIARKSNHFKSIQ